MRLAIPETALLGMRDVWSDRRNPPSLKTGSVASPADVSNLTTDCDALIIGGETIEREHVISIAPSIRVIGRLGVGVDKLDLIAFAERGLPVLTQPSFGSVEVASHALAMILALNRQLGRFDQHVREATPYEQTLTRIKALDGLRLGLVGAGAIGQALARLTKPMVADVVGYDPGLSTCPESIRALVGFADLLRECDVVSLHLPLTSATRHLIGARELATMKPESLLINVSRGGLVDELALAEALHSQQISGAGLDVFETEPLEPTSPLLSAPNLMLSPHVAWYSEASRRRLVSWTIEDIERFLIGLPILRGRLVG